MIKKISNSLQLLSKFIPYITCGTYEVEIKVKIKFIALLDQD